MSTTVERVLIFEALEKDKALKEKGIGYGLSLNTIYNMDCIEGMKLIPDGSIDAIITDPPYGTTACKWDTVIPFDLMREQLKRIIKPNGAIVLFGSEPFSSALRMSNIKNYKYDWVWNKILSANGPLARYQPLKIHETVSIFSYGGHHYCPQGTVDCEKTNYRSNTTIANSRKHTYIQTKTNFPKSIIKYSGASRKGKVNPTQKPVALIEYLIKTYTNEGETVLDFTMGSGTTAIACLNTNRNFIGFELDEGYRNIANKRIQDRLSENTLFS